MAFSQLAGRNKEQRNTVNFGLGVRTFQDRWMYGLNGFFDNELTGNNRRMGLGAELWRDYLKLSVNTYLRLSDWHQSRDFADYNERPANGYDIRGQAYLPTYPQLGGKLMFEQYRGDEVALFAKDNRQKNPQAVTIGLDYTPIPLLTLTAEHRSGSLASNDSRVSLQLNYRLGASWQAQINPSMVESSRTLVGSRYDFAERNNNIVLQYQKQELIRLSLPELLSGASGETSTVQAQVKSRYGLERIDWNSTELIAAGGSISPISATEIQLVLPPFNQINRYSLMAIAYDRQGNASAPASTQIRVTGQQVSVSKSTVQALPPSIAADGVATSQIIIKLNDEINQPVSGVASQLSLLLDFTASRRQLNPLVKVVDYSLSDISESSEGEYTAILTAGTKPGKVLITPSFNQQVLASTTVSLTAGEVAEEKSSFTAAPTSIVADNTEVSTLTFTAKDGNDNPVTGLTVTFAVTGITGTTVSTISEANGVYTATLTGTSSGTATVKPEVAGSVVGTLSKTITLLAGEIDPDKSSFTAAPTSIVADNTEVSTLTFTAKDGSDNPVTGLTVTFAVTGITGTTVSTISEANGVYTATLTGTSAGTATVKPEVAGSVVGTLSKTITLLAGEIDPDKSNFTAAPTSIVADNTEVSTLTFTAKDGNDNPVTGLTVTFAVTGVTGTTLSTTTESNGIYTATLTGTSAGTAMIKPQVEGSTLDTLSVTVELKQVVIFTKILVNDAIFEVTSNFPRTGFAGAHFQLETNNNITNNSNYNWASSDNSVTVTSAGIVSIDSVPSGNVTITATDKINVTNKTNYLFKLDAWFINNGNNQSNAEESEVFCAAQGSGYSLPSYTKLTNAEPLSSGSRVSNGILWSEWGKMDIYPNWTSNNYWAIEISATSNFNYFAGMTSGFLDYRDQSGPTRYMMCSRTL